MGQDDDPCWMLKHSGEESMRSFVSGGVGSSTCTSPEWASSSGAGPEIHSTTHEEFLSASKQGYSSTYQLLETQEKVAYIKRYQEDAVSRTLNIRNFT